MHMYKLHISIGIHSHTLPPTECLLDTGAGLDLMNASLVHKVSTSFIKNTKLLRLLSAIIELIQFHKTILIHLRIENLVTRYWLEIVPNLAVSLLLETLFNDRFIRRLFPSKRKFVPWHSKPVAIFAAFHRQDRSASAPLVSEKPLESFTNTETHQERLAQNVRILPSTAKAIAVPTLGADF